VYHTASATNCGEAFVSSLLYSPASSDWRPTPQPSRSCDIWLGDGPIVCGGILVLSIPKDAG
jgi:hypothetical protein